MPNYSHRELLCLLDTSSSMNSIRDEAIATFYSQIQEARNLEQSVEITLGFFSSELTTFRTSLAALQLPSIEEFPKFNSGASSLFDSIGQLLSEAGERYSEMNDWERPGTITVIIASDGVDSSSNLYSKELITDMIYHQRDVYNWKFHFIGSSLQNYRKATGISASAGKLIRSLTIVERMHQLNSRKQLVAATHIEESFNEYFSEKGTIAYQMSVPKLITISNFIKN